MFEGWLPSGSVPMRRLPVRQEGLGGRGKRPGRTANELHMTSNGSEEQRWSGRRGSRPQVAKQESNSPTGWPWTAEAGCPWGIRALWVCSGCGVHPGVWQARVNVASSPLPAIPRWYCGRLRIRGNCELHPSTDDAGRRSRRYARLLLVAGWLVGSLIAIASADLSYWLPIKACGRLSDAVARLILGQAP